MGEAVNTEEHVNNRCYDGEPDAPGLPGDKAFPEVEGAANPEKLADNQQHEDAEEEQEFAVEPGAKPKGAKDNQQDSDRALVSSEEADHLSPSSCRNGNYRLRAE